MPQVYELTMADQQLQLRADRTLWWPAQKILFLADLHAGKAEHMQLSGLRIPSGNLQSDLDRLQAAIDELQPKRVIVLGDLFHSDINSEWDIVTKFCKQQHCSIELVRGNHDRFISDDTFQSGGIIVHEENEMIEPFTLRHHPVENIKNRNILCGHVHPVYKLHGPGMDRLRLPCFVIELNQLILPAFGSFTGGFAMHRQPNMKLVATAPDYQNLIVATY